MTAVFSEQDLQAMKAHDLTPAQVKSQLDVFKRGSFYYRLNRSCTRQDGIVSVPEPEQTQLVALYEEEEAKGRMLKFVPASGAASRMFKDWHGIYNEGCSDANRDEILNSFDRYAFYDDLEQVISLFSLKELIAKKDLRTILDFVLTPRGLNYANLPKALLKFHSYPEGNRTALEEHLVEAALYVRDRQGICRLHLTLSEEHVPLIENYISKAARQYEEKLGITFQIGISTQMPSTDTVAADEDNGLFRDESGLPVFRPGGHGALIENLNALKADIVLIKNIDNIVPDRLKTVTVRYKKILGGFLLKLQASIFDYLRRLEEESLNSDLISEIVRFCENDLKIVFPSSFRPLDLKGQQDFLKERLHRPLRVCGVVKNEGEPGGGPFWVEEEDGTQSLQIIESAQVDFRFEDQKTIWKSAGYFNPVDLACGLRDYQGNSFDLSRFIDRRAYLIAEKSQGGRALKALEHPGLWNGAMAHWNTIFLEVPIETFNPVKTVEDLLRKQHQ